MLKFIQKYGAYLFLINNLLFSVLGFYEFATIIFLSLSIFFLITTLFNSSFIKNVVLNKSFNFYMFFYVLNITYFVFLEITDFESFKYMSAKIFQFIIFTSCIYFTYENFQNHIVKFLKFATFSSLLLSLVFNFPDLNTRYYGIFFNPNEFSIIMVYGFAVFLFNSKKNILNNLLLITFLILILISGSRSALIGVFIALYFYFKTVNFLFVSIALFFVLINYFSEIQTISRFINEDLFSNRYYEIIYALETFYNSFWLGSGLKNYAYIDKSLIKYTDQSIDFGAHNGYLSVLVQYGIIFSTAFFFYLFKNVYQFFKFLNVNNSPNYLLFKFILTYTLVNAFFENSLSGINFFQNSLFWLILGFLYYHIKEIKNNNNEDNILSN
jgi:O-antigen ligase